MAIETSPRFLACLPFVLGEEGGYTNDPHDPGGMTMKGLTQREFDKYRDSLNLPHIWVHDISDDELHDIYFADYWLPIAPNLPVGIDLSYFDFCVNAGPMRAMATLQRAVGIPSDGLWGPQTCEAIKSTSDVQSVIYAYAHERSSFYRSLANFKYFGKGWIGRTDRCLKASIAMAEQAGAVS